VSGRDQRGSEFATAYPSVAIRRQRWPNALVTTGPPISKQKLNPMSQVSSLRRPRRRARGAGNPRETNRGPLPVRLVRGSACGVRRLARSPRRRLFFPARSGQPRRRDAAGPALKGVRARRRTLLGSTVVRAPRALKT
jgi:hypothetical protein